MKKTLCILLTALALAGCQQQQPAATQQPDEQQQKDIAHKLILKSFNDLQNRDLKATIVDLETSIKINPSDPTAYLLLGQILLKVQQYDQAAGFLNMAAKNFPDDGTIYYMLGIADKMAGQKVQAVLAARHSVEIFQNQQDRQNLLRSAALLHELVTAPDDQAAPAADTQENAVMAGPND